MKGNHIPSTISARAVRDVLRLNQVIDTSRRDSSLRKRKKVYYFFDPAILDVFAMPMKYAPRLAALPSLLGVDEGGEVSEHNDADSSPAEILNGSALLTGQFIFNRALVGDGQDLYVAPEHMADFQGYWSRIEDGYNQAVGELTARDDRSEGRIIHTLHRRLREIKALRNDGSYTETQYLHRTQTSVLSSLAQVSRPETIPARHRLRQLVERDVLADASSLAFFTPEIIAPEYDKVQWWIDTITDIKKHNPRPSTREAIERDAVTLEQLYLLNQKHSRNPNAFLLITDDNGLFNAYEQRLKLDGGGFMPLRRVVQFSPILNINDMGGTFRLKSIFFELQAATKSVSDIFKSNDAGWETRLGTDPDTVKKYVDEIITKRKIDAADLRERIETVSSLWIRVLGFACSLKADLIEDAVEKEQEYWTSFARSRTFRHQFESALDGWQSSVTQVSTILRKEIWALKAPRKVTEEFGARPLPSKFTNFASSRLMGRSLSDIVDELKEKRLGGLDTVSSIEVMEERLLVMSALCLEVGAWAGADNLIRRANAPQTRQIYLEGSLGRELKFFKCRAIRLAADQRDWNRRFGVVDRELTALLHTSGKDAFEHRRLQSEMLGLLTCAVAWGHLEGRDEERVLINLSRLINVVRTIDSEILSSGKGFDQTYERPIMHQIYLNILDTVFWSQRLTGHVEDSLRPIAEKALRHVVDASSLFYESAHLVIYPKVAEIILMGPNGDTVGEIHDYIERLLKADKKAGFAFDLPAVDKIEFGEMQRFLQSCQ
jgi:hypothetical protein